jgi:hypothetical protein
MTYSARRTLREKGRNIEVRRSEGGGRWTVDGRRWAVDVEFGLVIE